MGDHPHAAAYRAAFKAFNDGDTDAFAEHLADDVVWHVIGGETMHGKEAVAESMSGLANLAFNIELHDVVANGDHLVALVTANVSADDKSITYRTAEIMHANADGKMTERWAFAEDSEAVVEFFAALG